MKSKDDKNEDGSDQERKLISAFICHVLEFEPCAMIDVQHAIFPHKKLLGPIIALFSRHPTIFVSILFFYIFHVPNYENPALFIQQQQKNH